MLLSLQHARKKGIRHYFSHHELQVTCLESLEKIDTRLVRPVIVFIPKGTIRCPERALRHAKYLGMRSLLPLIQRGADVFDKPYRHALRVWNRAKEKSDSHRAMGANDYFIPICNVERYLRKDHHDMVFNTTALYGNTEVRRVYSWREGTIGPLNLLENIAGARLRFLDWLPRRAARARRKACEARESGNKRRATELEYRAERFEDMSQQLRNTIRLQQCMREFSYLTSRKTLDNERISKVRDDIERLRGSRRCAPPVLKVRGHRVMLLVPFMSPDEELLRRVLPGIPRCRRAGVDRGLRYPIVLSVKNGGDTYDETKIDRQELFEKRERLRQRTRVLMSQTRRRRDNWERKRAMVQPPSFILKKERELEAVWAKVRRIDRQISHQLAAETVWFCEHRGVKTIYFEDLRFFQPRGGYGTHSWNLSTNLWGMIIEGVRYRREALGHKYGGVWTVNPAMTSQRCSACGERGVRVRENDSTEEERGGEYFYCPTCEMRLHADVNAARNIMMVQQEPSAVAGRTA
jgi:transposase